jgi:two-component system, NtrC family, nitrogen regulation response regulator GlnG
MAPAQVIELKDLPPELLGALSAEPASAALPAPVMHEPAAPMPMPLSAPAAQAAPVAPMPAGWLDDLEGVARRMLESGAPEVWDALTRQFEARLIHTALLITRGRRIEAAQKLGIGRNTITRKIQELQIDD